jgi:hypothetical protein
VVNQYYEAEVVSEYVIRGNTAVLKCNIPSFVADFVKVEAWVGSDASEYKPSQDIGIGVDHFVGFLSSSFSSTFPIDWLMSYVCPVVNQFYEAEILTEYVIKGNTAVLKCSIPSFVADFVKVESWSDDAGQVLTATDDIGKASEETPIPDPVSLLPDPSFLVGFFFRD